jgi:hypothetical protein
LDASLEIKAAPSPAPIRAEQGGFKLVIIDTPARNCADPVGRAVK